MAASGYGPVLESVPGWGPALRGCLWAAGWRSAGFASPLAS